MNEWMDHPAMEKMDPLKRELIKRAAEQTSGKNGKDLAPVMMALIGNANKRGIHFTSEETSLILSILKEGKSEKERAQIDQMIQMTNSLLKRGPK